MTHDSLRRLGRWLRGISLGAAATLVSTAAAQVTNVGGDDSAWARTTAAA
ncbi:hypothetical protein [Corallococcus sp. EGB]|nr:hypothetical protein [Corallococcus sp. EGB]